MNSTSHVTLHVFDPHPEHVEVTEGDPTNDLLTIRLTAGGSLDGHHVALTGTPEQLLELNRAIRNQLLDAIAARHTNTVDTPTVEDHFTGDAVTERLLHDADTANTHGDQTAVARGLDAIRRRTRQMWAANRWDATKDAHYDHLAATAAAIEAAADA